MTQNPLTVSFLITKISKQVFAIFIVTMIAFGCYFSVVSYLNAVDNAEQAALSRLEGIVHTVSVEAEQILREVSPDVSVEEQIQPLLFKASRSNQLLNGLHVFTTGHASAYAVEPAFRSHISMQRGYSPFSLGRADFESGTEVLYAYPITIGNNTEEVAFIFAKESIVEELEAATGVFIRQIGFSLFIMLSIAFLGLRGLKKIFSHEYHAKEQLKEFAKEVEENSAILATMSFALSKCDNLILLTDRDGKIEWINESLEERNNYSEIELDTFVGKSLIEVSHYPQIQEVIDKVVSTREKTNYEAKSYNSKQEEFWASTTVTPILDEMGEVERLIFVDVDITQIKQAEKEIAQMANFAEESRGPLIRIRRDGLVLNTNDAGEAVLRLWQMRPDQTIRKERVLHTITDALDTNQENKINLECDNRIYCLRFTPMPSKDYVNIYGEDITEKHIAEKIVHNRNHQLEQTQLNITDSITYARRIQQAILPNEDQIRQFFKDSFVMSKPKDIVSGDFFWVHEEVPNKVYLIALADCTGHGVPGAMMSIVGHGILNEIVENQKQTDPAKILNMLNREIIRSLKQKAEKHNSDGMDISMVRIDLEALEITYAGAYQSIFWMNGKLNVFKGDRQPIGGIHHDRDRTFTNHVFKVSKGDSLYLTSDGFVDQFGGPKDKKFKQRQFEEMLRKSHKFSMQAQSYLYENEFNDWKGRHEQVDDVSMIGIKF